QLTREKQSRHRRAWAVPKAGYGFAALRAWNEHRALVPQIHSLDGLGAPRMELVTKQGCHLHRVVIARHMCNSSFMEPHDPAIIHVEVGTIFTHSPFAMELNACSVSVHEKVL